MPYIKPEDRFIFQDCLEQMAGNIKTPGELNYVISFLLNELLKRRKAQTGKWGYTDINEFVGALECAKIEFYSRIACPYEEKKMQENGDVYDAKP